jgi:anthranilate phosphoribosyltransferase
MIRTVLPKLLEKKDLTPEEMEECFEEMMTGAATDAQIGAFLVSLRMKGEKPQEILAAARILRRFSSKVTSLFPDLVDVVGTGGDYSSSFNISTVAALIAAGAGAHVAKHGNRSISSSCGSADVLEALGVKVELAPEAVNRSIEKTGFGFMFAPLYHPSMKFVAGPRREMGVRTLFNMIGPLANPAGVKRQLIGVWDPVFLELYGQVLLELGAEQILIVWGGDGFDEITLTTSTEVCELKDGRLSRFTLDPKELGFEYCSKEDLKGGDAKENASIIERILKGEDSPRRDAAVLNAGAVLYVAGAASNLKEGVRLANEAIDGGKAWEVLKQLRKITDT